MHGYSPTSDGSDEGSQYSLSDIEDALEDEDFVEEEEVNEGNNSNNHQHDSWIVNINDKPAMKVPVSSFPVIEVSHPQPIEVEVAGRDGKGSDAILRKMSVQAISAKRGILQIINIFENYEQKPVKPTSANSVKGFNNSDFFQRRLRSKSHSGVLDAQKRFLISDANNNNNERPRLQSRANVISDWKHYRRAMEAYRSTERTSSVTDSVDSSLNDKKQPNEQTAPDSNDGSSCGVGIQINGVSVDDISNADDNVFDIADSSYERFYHFDADEANKTKINCMLDYKTILRRSPSRRFQQTKLKDLDDKSFVTDIDSFLSSNLSASDHSLDKITTDFNMVSDFEPSEGLLDIEQTHHSPEKIIWNGYERLKQQQVNSQSHLDMKSGKQSINLRNNRYISRRNSILPSNKKSLRIKPSCDQNYHTIASPARRSRLNKVQLDDDLNFDQKKKFWERRVVDSGEELYVEDSNVFRSTGNLLEVDFPHNNMNFRKQLSSSSNSLSKSKKGLFNHFSNLGVKKRLSKSLEALSKTRIKSESIGSDKNLSKMPTPKKFLLSLKRKQGQLSRSREAVKLSREDINQQMKEISGSSSDLDSFQKVLSNSNLTKLDFNMDSYFTFPAPPVDRNHINENLTDTVPIKSNVVLKESRRKNFRKRKSKKKHFEIKPEHNLSIDSKCDENEHIYDIVKSFLNQNEVKSVGIPQNNSKSSLRRSRSSALTNFFKLKRDKNAKARAKAPGPPSQRSPGMAGVTNISNFHY